MAFINPQQRAAFFAKQKAQNPLGNPQIEHLNVGPSNAPPANTGALQPVQVAGLPKAPRFGRVRKMFKI